jgi:23S rRNA (cytosine1962-C5)-methyltransferase
MSSAPQPAIAAAPLVMSSPAWRDYGLVDSGGGRKLERYGSVRVIRPEAQCFWAPALDEATWDMADAVFEGAGDDDLGRWRFLRRPPETWPMTWRDIRFDARLTAFRHLGVFPEQAANWAWLADTLADEPPGARILNLFGYTGVATLVAAAGGASVTHLDASKKAVGWARGNALTAGLAAAPIRWICDDGRAYVRREIRRGEVYQGIILDPPKYGRGPSGEVWKLYEDLPELLAGCAALLAHDARFLLLNAYSERLTGLALAGLMAECLTGRGGRIDWGELALAEESGRYGVGVSFFARWQAT